MICYFIDHTSCDNNEQELAKLSLTHKASNFLDPKNGISLITCHRIEYYINSRDNKQTFEKIFKDFNKILVPSQINLRLFEISLGLRSKIIGENSIFKQASQSIQNYLYHNPQNKNFMNILSNAKITRDRFKFWAKNHGQLVYDHIKNSNGKTLLLFGASSLNQTIISSINFNVDYGKIVLITRNIKRAKKYINFFRFPIEITDIYNININLLNNPYDIFIATDQIDMSYQKEIVNLCANEKCLNVVDVSSSPLSEISSITNNYFSMYSETTNNFIMKSNLKMEQKKIDLMKYLEGKEYNWYIN